MYAASVDCSAHLEHDGIVACCFPSFRQSTFFRPLTARSAACNTVSLLLLTNRNLLFLRAADSFQALANSVLSPRQALEALQSFSVARVVPLPRVSEGNAAQFSKCLWLSERLVILDCCQQGDDPAGAVCFDVESGQSVFLPCPCCAICAVSEDEFCCESRAGEVTLVHVEITGEEGAFCGSLCCPSCLVLTTVSTLLTLPQFCESLTAIHSPELHIIARSAKGKLFFDSSLLCSNVVSAVPIQSLLLYIINDVVPHLCLLPLSQLPLFSQFTQPVTGEPTLALASRALERGSVYVGCGDDGRVVVQLPRGNLETVYPRLLACAHLKHVVFDSDSPERWCDAVEFMRRQRIRGCGRVALPLALDLLYDMSPAYFLEHVEEFITAQRDCDRLNLFLSNLAEYVSPPSITLSEDFTADGHDYAGVFAKPSTPTPADKPSTPTPADKPSTPDKPAPADKRNIICSAFYPLLLRSEATLLPAITCLCSFKPPRYETALQVIHDQLEKEGVSECVPLARQDEEEEEEVEEESCGMAAMKWLLILVDPSIIYNVALGTYSMELTQMVASLSQRDPREYMPILQRYNSVPIGCSLPCGLTSSVRRYWIDKDLKRFVLVLRDIASLLTDPSVVDPATCVPPSTTPYALEASETLFQEAVRLMQEKNLTHEMITCFKDSPFRAAAFKEVALHFMQRQQFAEAMRLLLLLKPVPYALLMQCALQLNDVDTYLTCVASSITEPRERAQAVQQLCRQLRTGGKAEVLQAAALYVRLARDCEA